MLDNHLYNAGHVTGNPTKPVIDNRASGGSLTPMNDPYAALRREQSAKAKIDGAARRTVSSGGASRSK